MFNKVAAKIKKIFGGRGAKAATGGKLFSIVAAKPQNEEKRRRYNDGRKRTHQRNGKPKHRLHFAHGGTFSPVKPI